MLFLLLGKQPVLSSAGRRERVEYHLSNRLVLQVCSYLVLTWKETKVSDGKTVEISKVD